MTNAEEQDQFPTTDRLRSAAAIIRMPLIGPAFLGWVISHLIAGELPGRKSNYRDLVRTLVLIGHYFETMRAIRWFMLDDAPKYFSL